MATSISKKPTGKVSSLASPAREANTNKVKATWKNGSSLFSSKSNSRFEGHEWWWTIGLSDGSKTKTWTTKTSKGSGSSRSSATLNLGSFKLSNGKTKGTADFYPNTSWHVTSVTVHVRGWNSKGHGDAVTATRKFGRAEKPTISALVQGDENGDVTCTITCDEDAGKGYHPRTDTRYQLTVIDTRKSGSERKSVTDSTFGGNSKALSYDVSDRQQLAYTQYVHLHVKAWCRGFGGKSDDVERQLYVSWPNQPVIKTASVSCPARGTVGKVTVPVDLKKTTEHPVTGVKLQKLVGVSYTSASQIPANAGWEDCGVADDGQCTALSVATDEVLPEEGARTWLRVKSWNQIEGLFVRYSEPIQLTKLYKSAPTAEDDQCAIVSIASASDGNGAVVVVGFGNDGNTGTEVTWSADSGAWESTEQPESFKLEWNDSPRKSQSWAKTATLAVRGLDEGTEYFFRARRYLESDGGTTHSPWSAQKSVTPALAPSGVVLSAPSYVERGRGCETSWAYEGGTQKSWRLLSSGKVVASGTDSIGSYVIPAGDLARLSGAGGSLSLTVEVATAGGHAESAAVTVTLSDAPGLSLGDAVVTAQPLSFDAACSDKGAALAVTVRSQGCTSAGPGSRDQVAGDVVWSQMVAPAWSASDGNGLAYEATVTGPDGLDLRDGARYTVTAVAIDAVTGLASGEETCELLVEWGRRAPAPVAHVTPSDTMSQEGERRISCDIEIGTPTGAAAGDLCDVWRLTPDGEVLVLSGAALGDTVTDPWAPFGYEAERLAYRVVLRTIDGDMEWSDFAYQLPARELRIDFGGSYVELPYNLGSGESWEKDTRIERKLSGDVDGYWNQGTLRKASLTTDLIRVEDEETAQKVRALATFAGPCLVRTPDGCCYMASVEVSNLTFACDSALLAVSLDATEVTLTSDYMAVLPAEEEDGE